MKIEPKASKDQIMPNDEIVTSIERLIGTDSAILADGIIGSETIQAYYEKYLDLVKLEVSELKVKPTELRHLIGRLGEFYCALKLNGTLAHTPNQHGFDVVCENGRRVSVKTTAQKTGFVPVSSKTLHLVDDLMVVQYFDGAITTVYYGNVKRAVEAARFYEPDGNFELDLSKARKLMNIDQSKVITIEEQTTSVSLPSNKKTMQANDDFLSPKSNHEIFLSALKKHSGKILTTGEIKKIILKNFPDFSEGSLLPNDHAHGNKSSCSCAGTDRRIFDRIERGSYLVL
jgi:hypothetical protein